MKSSVPNGPSGAGTPEAAGDSRWNANVDHSGGTDTWTVSPNFSFPIAGNLGGYVEAGRTSGGGESDSRAGGGLTLLLHDRVQLDLYALHGLDHRSTDLTAGFGVSMAWQ